MERVIDVKLTQAVTKMAELPQILNSHGITHSDVLGMSYDALPIRDMSIRVNLHSKDAIERLGICETRKSSDGICYTVVKDGIRYVHYDV